MRNADFKNLNLSHRNINRRLNHLEEDIEILSDLFRAFLVDPANTRKELMDAIEPQISGPVSNDYQSRWLDNIRRNKLRKLISMIQQKQRNAAALKVSPQEAEKAIIAANHIQ